MTARTATRAADTTTTDAPVRRSPLAAEAAQLGATWIASALHWAADYGDVSAEIAAATSAVGVADWGPTDKLAVKGPAQRRVLDELGIGAPLGTVADATLQTTPVRSWALAPDETLLVVPADGAAGPAVTAAMTDGGAVVTELSSGLAGLRILGPAARELLLELCAVDLAADRFAPRRIAQAPMANVRVTLTRRDLGEVPGFELLVARDQAAYLFEALLHVGAVHGVRPVGQRAVDAIAGGPLW